MPRWVVPVLVVAVALVLHQDFWNWTNGGLVLGALPVGLAYHLGYSVLASLVLAWLVRVAWPAGLDDDDTSGGGGR